MEMKLATRLDNLAFIVSATSLQSLMSELSSEKIQGRKCRRNERGMHETLQRSEKSKKSDTSLSDPVLQQNLSPSLHRAIVSAAWISKQSLTVRLSLVWIDPLTSWRLQLSAHGWTIRAPSQIPPPQTHTMYSSHTTVWWYWEKYTPGLKVILFYLERFIVILIQDELNNQTSVFVMFGWREKSVNHPYLFTVYLNAHVWAKL